MIVAIVIFGIIYSAGALFTFAWLLGINLFMAILMSEKPNVGKLLLLSLGWPIWLVRAMFTQRRR